jgi:uncharacterized protein (TIGR03084 family)
VVALADMLADLTAESADVDAMVADLPPPQWAAQTPAAGWTIAHQIAHLSWTDEASRLAIVDPDAFVEKMVAALSKPTTYVDRGAEEFLDEPSALLARWRAGRTALNEALASVPDGQKIPWYGTAMSPVSMATARIMETWAHGLDIAQTLGVQHVPTARLRHVAHLGYRTYAHSFLAHGLDAPVGPVHLRLTAPDGSLWTFGPEDARDRVTGSAEDFCLLVTQRRNRADLDLVAEGANADAWLDVAQAFAGPPGAGREAAGKTP